MSTHVRQQIREAIENLVTGLLTTGDCVYQGRDRPVGSGHAPCLLIYSGDELADRQTIGQDPILTRSLNVVIEGRVSAVASADIENVVDQIAVEVEPVMAGAAPRLGGLASDMVLVATRRRIREAGNKHEGEIRLVYRVFYRTRAKTPTAVA